MNRWIVPLVLSFAMLAGCSSDAAPGAAPTEPTDGEASLRMTLKRSASSLIPVEAESAYVRVWNPATAINAVKKVAIPAPGATGQVEFLLPVGEGYSVAVAAFESGFFPRGLAFGVTENVAIRSGQANEAVVDARPLQMDVAVPATVESAAQMEAIVTVPFGGIPELFSLLYLYWGTEPWGEDGASAENVAGPARASWSATLNAPTVESDSALYLQAAVFLDPEAWTTGGRFVRFFSPSVEQGDSLIRVPVTLPSSGLTVLF